MPTKAFKQLKLFYCYAREDKKLRDELDKHLSLIKRQNKITSWHDREISPGMEREKEIDAQLNSAHIILLLVSASFLDSNYCYGIEMKRALERHTSGKTRVIPIILRPVYWEKAPFSHLQVLPVGAKPVTQWKDRNEALRSITTGIAKAIQELAHLQKTQEEWIREGNSLFELERYEDALLAYEQSLRLDPNNAIAWSFKGDTLWNLERCEDALLAYEQNLRLDPNNAITQYNITVLLKELKRTK